MQLAGSELIFSPVSGIQFKALVRTLPDALRGGATSRHAIGDGSQAPRPPGQWADQGQDICCRQGRTGSRAQVLPCPDVGRPRGCAGPPRRVPGLVRRPPVRDRRHVDIAGDPGGVLGCALDQHNPLRMDRRPRCPRGSARGRPLAVPGVVPGVVRGVVPGGLSQGRPPLQPLHGTCGKDFTTHVIRDSRRKPVVPSNIGLRLGYNSGAGLVAGAHLMAARVLKSSLLCDSEGIPSP